jgi:hypothetical protein
VKPAVLTLAIPRTLQSQNVRDRWHWRQRHQDTKVWEIMLRAAVRQLPPRPRGMVWVRITSLRAQLILDDANLRGGAKGLVDALVRLGFLRDDSSQFCHITYRQVQTPKPLRCTRIVISHERPA